MSVILREKLNEIKNLKKQIELDEKNGKKINKQALANIDLMEKVIRNMNSDFSKGKANLTESLTTTDAVNLIPKIIEGKLREAAEPEYLGTQFFKKIHVDGSNTAVYVIPIVGEVVAGVVAESGKYPEDSTEFTTIENNSLEIRVQKIGSKVVITEEAIQDSSWDILGINIDKMGKAMARYKEELIFNNFSNHGHVVFDNNIRQQDPEAGTTGCGQDGNYNDTLSVEDMLDMALTLMANDFTPTDIIMHPLTWVVFARNSMIGNGLTFGALGGNQVHPWGATQGTPGFAGLASTGDNQKLIMTPEQVQNRLPMPLTMNFSPFVRFDKQSKRFDMYCLDRTEVGVIVEREGLTTEQWKDPERDIRSLKCKERYGIGILNSGKSIVVAKNLAVAPTYPVPPTVNINTNK